MLAKLGWEDDGYRLFGVSTLAGSSARGWFGPLGESNALFCPRSVWDAPTPHCFISSSRWRGRFGTEASATPSDISDVTRGGILPGLRSIRPVLRPRDQPRNAVAVAGRKLKAPRIHSGGTAGYPEQAEPDVEPCDDVGS
jgi:hypothetical protein